MSDNAGTFGFSEKNARVFQTLLKAFLVDDITLIITLCPGYVLMLLLISKFQSVLCYFLMTHSRGLETV